MDEQLPFTTPEYIADPYDYWEKLRVWAVSVPAQAHERLETLDEHRALVDRITERMTL